MTAKTATAATTVPVNTFAAALATAVPVPLCVASVRSSFLLRGK